MGIQIGRIEALCAERGITCYRMCKDIGISPGIITDVRMGRKTSLSSTTASKISQYLGCSVPYLLGETDDRTVQLDEDVLRAAFFGGYEGLTREQIDAMWKDVRRFADFIVEQARREEQK